MPQSCLAEDPSYMHLVGKAVHAACDHGHAKMRLQRGDVVTVQDASVEVVLSWMLVKTAALIRAPLLWHVKTLMVYCMGYGNLRQACLDLAQSIAAEDDAYRHRTSQLVVCPYTSAMAFRDFSLGGNSTL